MCFYPNWRIAMKPRQVMFAFGSLAVRGYNPTNGAFVFPVSDKDYLEKLLSCFGTNMQQYILDNLEQIPCGKCLQCRVNDSREWAQRATAEATLYEHNWFVTLTYDNEHLPQPYWTIDRRDGEYRLCSPLVYDDFELFKKRLLEYFRDKYDHTGIRFLMCGEYGPKNGRPHYHTILFNCPLDDVKVISNVDLNGKKYTYCHSDILEQKWQKGFITIGNVNWDTTAYVARYVLKKFAAPQEREYLALCQELGCKPLPAEMRKASLRPGLGRPYYELHKDEIYKYDKVVLPDGHLTKPCSYFDRLFDLEDSELLDELKKMRKKRAEIALINELRGKVNPDDYIAQKQDKFRRSISKLKRTNVEKAPH